MALTARAAWSDMPGAWDAAQDAASLASQALGVEEAQLAVAFYPYEKSHSDLIEGMRLCLGNIPLVGCSAPLSFAAPDPPGENVSVMLFALENIEVMHRIFSGADRDELPSWTKGFLEGAPQGRQHLLLVLGAGPAEELAPSFQALRSEVGNLVSVTGAFSSGRGQGSGSSVCVSGHAPAEGIAALFLAGRFRWGAASAHGWSPASCSWEITEASGSLLDSLDGVPAVKLYETYFQKSAAELDDYSFSRIGSLYPLGLDDGGEGTILPVLGVTGDGALRLGCPAPGEGSVRLMFNSRENLAKTARAVTASALDCLDGAEPRALLVFSDVARADLLGHDRGKEMEAIRSVAGEHVPLLGFFSSAQVVPDIAGRDFDVTQQAWKRPRFHSFSVRNHSLTVLALSE